MHVAYGCVIAQFDTAYGHAGQGQRFIVGPEEDIPAVSSAIVSFIHFIEPYAKYQGLGPHVGIRPDADLEVRAPCLRQQRFEIEHGCV